MERFPATIEGVLWLFSHQHLYHAIVKFENRPTWTRATIEQRKERLAKLWRNFFGKFQAAHPLAVKHQDGIVRAEDYMQFLEDRLALRDVSNMSTGTLIERCNFIYCILLFRNSDDGAGVI
jgi:hypothetical protein